MSTAKPETRNSWQISLPCGQQFAMVGAPCSWSEAREAARLIWPDAKVLRGKRDKDGSVS